MRPILAQVEAWLSAHQKPLEVGQHLKVPVLCLLWTHYDINKHMMFGHGNEDNDSIYKLVDQLLRGTTTPNDIEEPLEIVDFRGADGRREIYSLSNRRLTALHMYQALRGNEMVEAFCVVRSQDSEKFNRSWTTTTGGLTIQPRDGISLNFGAPLFQRGDAVLHELQNLEERNHDNRTRALLDHLKTRPSIRERDGVSLTLTRTST